MNVALSVSQFKRLSLSLSQYQPQYSETHTTFPHIWTFLLHVSKRCIFLNMFDTVVYVSCFNRDGDTLLRYFPRSGAPFLSSFSSWLKELKKKKRKKYPITSTFLTHARAVVFSSSQTLFMSRQYTTRV